MINKESALKMVNNYIAELENLLKFSYKEGEDKKSQLISSIINFIRNTFSDSKEKLHEFDNAFPKVFLLGHEETEKEKQEDYINDLKTIQRYLNVYKEQLEIELTSSQEFNKIDKLKQEVELQEQESKRREIVAESKAFGALIEVIDLLRNQVKEKSKIETNIVEIKNSLKEIKEKLDDLDYLISMKN